MIINTAPKGKIKMVRVYIGCLKKRHNINRVSQKTQHLSYALAKDLL